MGGINALEARRRILLNTPHIETASGSIATFNTDMVGKLKECKIYFEPIQEGEGDPSPDNVRPITGWSGVEVKRTGVNLSDGVAYHSAISYNIPFVYSFNPITSPYNIVVRFDGAGFVAEVKAGHSYVFSSDLTGATTNVYWGIYKSLASMTNRYNCIQYGRSVRSFTAPVDGYVLFIRYSNANTTATWSYAQLELGDTATEFDPYQGTTIPIDWTDEAGTVYGGYVDLVKGEVVAEWGYIASYNGENLPSNWISNRDVYVAGATPTIGAQVAYRLATPIHYPIDPITLKTLRGTNNIFANTNGDTEVKFYTH